VTVWHLLLLYPGSPIAGAVLCLLAFALWKPSPFSEDNIVILTTSAVGFTLYSQMAATSRWPPVREWFSFSRPKVLIVCFLAPTVIAAALIGLCLLAVWLFGDIIPDIDHSVGNPDTLAQLPLAILAMVVVAPALEELLFRGVLFVWLRARASLLVSTLLASLIFGLLHDNHYSAGLFSIFFLGQRVGVGLCTTLLAQHFRSLAPGYAFHAGWNLVVAVSGVFAASLT
jgi:membrane protease YdiL (CAAX protease family)